MAPRRKKSPTSDLAHDAEMRLDATTGADEPDLKGQPPTQQAAPSDMEPALAATPEAEKDSVETREDAPEPVAGDPQPEKVEPQREATEPPSAPEVRAVEPSPAMDAPPVQAARPLAGDRPRPSARPKRRSKALLALIAAAAGVGLVWAGAFSPFLSSGEDGAEGHNPPPKIADASTREAPRSATEPRPVVRPEGDGAVADELRALKDNLARADVEASERVGALNKRIEELEKQHAETVTDLRKRLENAERQLAAVGSGAAAARPQATAPAANPASAETSAQAGDVTAPDAVPTDPVIASTGANAANPLPQPRPQDLSSVNVVRPSETRQATAAPSSPVLRNWVLRDVYAGVALIEGRYGMIEVVEGSVLPGGGVVQEIRRAGGRWVVTTNRGIIASR